MKNKEIRHMGTDPGSDDLYKELREENDFLSKLVDSIPAKMYFAQDIQKKIATEKHYAMDKVSAELKKNSKDIGLSVKSKHKRARFNPAHQKTVSQIHEELDQKEEKVKSTKGSFVPKASFTRVSNAVELKKRLQEKIDFFQAQRKAFCKDAVKKNRLKVKKVKHKQGNLVKAQALKNIEKPKTPKTEPKPVFNKEINLIYSKFNFDEDGQVDKKRNEYAGKTAKTLLKKAEKKKEKIESLKNTDPEKAKVVEEKEKWKKAILKTEGIKVKDDPGLLRKSLKKEEKLKKKSAKAWKGRIEETEKRQKFRQDKRTKNIKQRKQEKQQKKIKSAKKKGRVILN